jgi:hypothetical protein
MRRVTVGNFTGATKVARQRLAKEALGKTSLLECERQCVLNKDCGSPVEIQMVINYITAKQ